MVKIVDMLGADGTAVPVKLMSTARTALRYKQLFRRDLFQDLQELSTSEAATGGAADNAGTIKQALDFNGFLERLAFTMWAQCEGKDFKALAGSLEDEMADWLDRLDTMACSMAGQEIISCYMDSRGTSTEAKKK